jgi:serine/threonine-protein kinase HipA
VKTDLEIHLDGQWIPAATLQALDVDRCRLDYLPEYLFAHPDPQPLSLTLGLQMQPDVPLPADGGALEGPDRRPPPFLMDLVPQGKGRTYLLGLLGLSDSERMVLPLLSAGAFNPIGRLRIRSAVDFYDSQRLKSSTEDGVWREGFDIDDILRKSEGFLEHLSMHAMLAAGTTGVQGVAPKYLLSQDAQGRWFADLALSDEQARAHWLVKLPRGRSDADRAVLRNEAAYLRVARAVGLRTHHEPMLVGEMLFVRRFDREVNARGLHRLHQESVASLAGLRGFGAPTTMNAMLAAIRAHVSDPLAETIEFMKRDALNLALRNTDNHARNTAVQKTLAGEVRLTPLFDFAPMFMDPEIVPRGVNWVFGDRRVSGYTEVIERVSATLPGPDAGALARAMKAFAVPLAGLRATALDMGVERQVLSQCEASIDRLAAELDRIAT